MATQLLSAEHVYMAPPGAPAGVTAAQAVVLTYYRHRPGQVPTQLVGQLKGPMPDGMAATQVTATAVVNHGRWTVECPYPGCFSAQYAADLDRRFFCVECGNAGTGKWVPVTWPAPTDVAAIEAALMARPDVRTRNWAPPETVAQLVAENTGHLVPGAVGTTLAPAGVKAT